MTPDIYAQVENGTQYALVGATGADPTKLYYTFSVPSGGTVTGWYYVSGDLTGEFEFTAVGIVEVVLIVEKTSTIRHYQTTPEDELDRTYTRQLVDNYPWRRDIQAGGEVLDAGNEPAELEISVSHSIVPDTVIVLDENQRPLKILGVDNTLIDRGYVILQNATTDRGQRAVAFYATEDIPTPTGQTLHAGAPSTIVPAELGTPYHVGAVKGVLVADPKNHWTPAHYTNMVCWLHCGEHPQQRYTLADLSDYALTETDFAASAFAATYHLQSRTWDSSRGWALTLAGKTASSDAEFISITKARPVTSSYTLSFWLKATPILLNSGEWPVITYGPVTVKIGGYNVAGSPATVQYAQFYVKNPSGTDVAIGAKLPLLNTFQHYALSVSALNPDDADVTVDACSTTNITSLLGLPTVDGIALQPTQLLLLTGQTDPRQNGCYAVSEDLWYRIAVVQNFDERNARYFVKNGTNTGIYRCTNSPEETIEYGDTEIQYEKCNSYWTGTPNQLSTAYTGTAQIRITSIVNVTSTTLARVTTSEAHGLSIGDFIYVSSDTADFAGKWQIQDITDTSFDYDMGVTPTAAAGVTTIRFDTQATTLLQPFTASDTQLRITAPDYEGSPSVTLSDLRIWSIGKTPDELQVIERPRITSLSVACRPTFFTTTSGAWRSLQVLPSGYVVPGTRPVNFYLETLTATTRYNSLGEYVGPDHRLQVGLGDAAIPAAIPLLLGHTSNMAMPSNGLGIAASTSSHLPGFNAAWMADTPAAQYRRVPFAQRASPDTDISVLVNDPTSSYHPTELAAQNPNQARIYVLGEDNNMYRVSVHVRRTGTLDTPELFAQRVYQYVAEERPTHYPRLSTEDGTTIEVLDNATFYDLVVSYVNSELYSSDSISDAQTVLERTANDWNGRLAVQITAGTPTVTQLTGATRNTVPVFLWAHAQNYLDYALIDHLDVWLNPTAYGQSVGLPCRSTSGPIIIEGTDAQIDSGKYRLAIDVTNAGDLDNEFTGFSVEVSISAFLSDGSPVQGSKITPATLLTGGNPKFIVSYTYGDSLLRAQQRNANCKPGRRNLAEPEADFDASLQAALDELSALTGGIDVLVSDQYPSVLGGPYWVKFTETGAKPLLKFQTTAGFTAAVTREITGNDTTQEIQKIVFNRPMTVVDFDITTPILADSTHYWTVQIYLTNPLVTPTTTRNIMLHGLWLYRVKSQLYQIDPTQSGLLITPVAIVEGDTPATKPGGFQCRVSDLGVDSYKPEQNLYPTSATLGDTANNPDLPVAHLLTGSTESRTSSLILQNPTQLANADSPAALTAPQVKLMVDHDWPLGPDYPRFNTLLVL